MQSMCRCSVSRASTVLQWNINLQYKDSSSHGPRVCIAAVDFLLSCCFSTWDNPTCTFHIKANPAADYVEYQRARGAPVEENVYLNRAAARSDGESVATDGGIVASVQLCSLMRNTY